MKTSFFGGLVAGLLLSAFWAFFGSPMGWWGGMSPLRGDHRHAHWMEAQDVAGASRMSARLRTALSAGDADAVQALLDPQVVIYESGGVENGFAEYAAHHLPADMAFLRDMQHEILDEQTRVFGGQALYWSRSRVRGVYKDKPMDLYSNETLWLHRVDGQWRIQHIHWSSREAS